MNFNISKMVDWLKKLFHYCICLEPRTMSRDVYLRVTTQMLFPKSL